MFTLLQSLSAWLVPRVNGTFMVATGQGKVREFCAGSWKFLFLRKVRKIQEYPLKVREILLSHARIRYA